MSFGVRLGPENSFVLPVGTMASLVMMEVLKLLLQFLPELSSVASLLDKMGGWHSLSDFLYGYWAVFVPLLNRCGFHAIAY